MKRGHGRQNGKYSLLPGTVGEPFTFPVKSGLNSEAEIEAASRSLHKEGLDL